MDIDGVITYTALGIIPPIPEINESSFMFALAAMAPSSCPPTYRPVAQGSWRTAIWHTLLEYTVSSDNIRTLHSVQVQNAYYALNYFVEIIIIRGTLRKQALGLSQTVK